MQESILQSIGKTPLVRLRRVAEGVPAQVYVKVESQNPGGSVQRSRWPGHDSGSGTARLAGCGWDHY